MIMTGECGERDAGLAVGPTISGLASLSKVLGGGNERPSLTPSVCQEAIQVRLQMRAQGEGRRKYKYIHARALLLNIKSANK